MLPATARLRRSQDFTLVMRRGRRAGRPRLVVHALRRDPSASGSYESPRVPDGQSSGNETGVESARERSDSSPTLGAAEHPRVGFVVSKAVGNAVRRHRVARQLRHLMRQRLAALPAGTLVVVRALPPAAAATSDELARDLDKALRRLRLPNPRDAAWGGGDSPGGSPSTDPV
ncbi:ribonuclease P protein component [Actinopolyspora mortivallis]|uniref:Ribonuclease P protein component n=1 Tax=Actinopolyspora mortivallis TaxID=33906 RepID=A0A2T0GWJ3_ACTMO|nr:ribonuclease P protein component [Actinopolyspora mortivallis]PRW63481.1 ribonuclease P protein component [Actinopolyspora mortivallis]